MSILYASSLVARLGPCHIFLDRAPNGALAQELVLQGCAVSDLDDAASDRRGPDVRRVGLFQWPGAKAGGSEIRRYAAMDVLVVISGDHDRPDVDECLFANGWQRHAAGMAVGEHAAFTDTTLPGTTYYQKIPATGGRSRSHLRRGGAEADMFLARYAAAAGVVRPGDHVLIDGEDYADAAQVTAALSGAGALTCVAAKKAAIDLGTIPVTLVDPDLAAVADHSIDMIFALEPVVPADWQSRLRDYARVLRHDGRILIGWREDRRTVCRSIPADWNELFEEACEQFIPEYRYIHRLNGGYRVMHATGLCDSEPSDWMMLLAAANPLDGAAQRERFVHPGFPTPQVASGAPAVIDFGAGYDNPYLYRSMVQIGERLTDEVKLVRVAECVIEDSRPDSADRGAALSVIGYRILEQRLVPHVPAIIAAIETYLEQTKATTGNPHVTRWRISLAFLAARLSELVEDRAAAIAFYRQTAQGNWADFSPLIATKAIAASFYQGRLHLSDGDMAAAKACFQHGVATAMAAAQASHAGAIGDPECPVPFYLTELAEVMDMGSQCANAVARLHLWSRDPGAFWRHVDVRRFGLASWAADVQRENERLRAAA
jgi:hypothetical protein